ncbi:hypothetical protein V502_02958 [Pseudogymnoascus sp. VKM F-4520 (FW-2644)]|nr:hypothetical protein V502_02958 [Pseudogymnoascus sp. VKM F-4520 (FW-2644)]
MAVRRCPQPPTAYGARNPGAQGRRFRPAQTTGIQLAERTVAATCLPSQGFHGGRVAVIVTVSGVPPAAVDAPPLQLHGGARLCHWNFYSLRDTAGGVHNTPTMGVIPSFHESTFGIEIDLRIEMSEKPDSFEGSRLWAPTQQEPRGGDSTPATPLRAGPASAHGGGPSPLLGSDTRCGRLSPLPFLGTTIREHQRSPIRDLRETVVFSGPPPPVPEVRGERTP